MTNKLLSIKCNFVKLCAGSQTYCAIQYFYISANWCLGQNFAFIQVERCKQWLFKVGDWCFILVPEGAYGPLGTFSTTWSYSHVVRWPELTVGCEVNNHSPSPVQGERGWVHCVHKNWSPVKCKTSSRRFVEYFQGWKKKFLFTHIRTHGMWMIESNLFLLIIRSSLTSLLLRLIRPPKLGSQEVILMRI